MGVYQTSVKQVQAQDPDIPPLSYIDIMPRCLKKGNIKGKVRPTFDNFRLYSLDLYIFLRFLCLFSPTILNPFPNKPWFLRVCSRCLENTVGKGEITCNEQFLLFPTVFFTNLENFLPFS